MESADQPESGRTLSRRELIKRGLTLGSVSYVAPMVIGSATPVSAQTLSGFGCDNPAEACEDESAICGDDCGCLTSREGDPVCVVLNCGPSCESGAECPDGMFCIDFGGFENDSCCDNLEFMCMFP